MRKLLMITSLLVAMLGLLAACGAQTTTPEIIQHLKDTAAQTNTLHMVVNVSMDMTMPAGSGTATTGLPALPSKGSATIELWYQKPNLLRAEVRQMDPSTYNGTIIVADGTALWAYDPAHKTGYKLDMTALKSAGQMANLPVDLQTLLSDPDLATTLDHVLSLVDTKLVGNEQVGSFQTYKLDLQPKADTGLANAAVSAHATLWVDQATWTIVKLEATTAQGSLSYSAQSVDFNKDVPADTFKFTLPSGARGIDLTMFAPRATTLDQARQDAATQGFTLLTPSYVPAGDELTAVTAMPMGQGFVLNYSGSAQVPSFALYEGLTTGGKALPAGLGSLDQMMKGQMPEGAKTQAVQVRGVTGQAFTRAATGTDSGGSFVMWQEKGSTLRIGLGGKLSLDETLKIAESLK